MSYDAWGDPPEYDNDTYEEGQLAYADGVALRGNPYDYETQEAEHEDWVTGWEDARSDDEYFQK